MTQPQQTIAQLVKDYEDNHLEQTIETLGNNIRELTQAGSIPEENLKQLGYTHGALQNPHFFEAPHWALPLKPVAAGLLMVEVDGQNYSVWEDANAPDGERQFVLLNADQVGNKPHIEAPQIETETVLIDPVTNRVLDPEKYNEAFSHHRPTGELIDTRNLRGEVDWDDYDPVQRIKTVIGAAQDGEIEEAERVSKLERQFEDKRNYTLAHFYQLQEAAGDSIRSKDPIATLTLDQLEADGSVRLLEGKRIETPAPEPKVKPENDVGLIVEPALKDPAGEVVVTQGPGGPVSHFGEHAFNMEELYDILAQLPEELSEPLKMLVSWIDEALQPMQAVASGERTAHTVAQYHAAVSEPNEEPVASLSEAEAEAKSIPGNTYG